MHALSHAKLKFGWVLKHFFTLKLNLATFSKVVYYWKEHLIASLNLIAELKNIHWLKRYDFFCEVVFLRCLKSTGTL